MGADQEGQPFEPRALLALAKAADGSMRDALSLTDQALAHGNGSVRLRACWRCWARSITAICTSCWKPFCARCPRDHGQDHRDRHPGPRF
ncbi:hypothetical protein [Aeromonas salmonicida]|uniref:hypothetical protein n=1 Tax=Aeromonas salmonicida TaxID=645 RepID=UPI003F4CDD3C